MIKQVTTLDATTVKTIVLPGPRATLVILQNKCSVSVFLSIDGGTTETDGISGATGADPTTSTGYELAAGQQLILGFPYNPNVPKHAIRAIQASAVTCKINICTDDMQSTFPTT